MWLRRLFAASLDLEELAADTPAGVPWQALPARCVLQLHWHPTDQLVAGLDEHGFRTVVLTRHPLDVLVSILQFAQREPRTARWLNGTGGDERTLLGADPCSHAFLTYAGSARARALLETTVLWRRSERLDASVSYEDLVADPTGELERLTAALGATPVVAPGDAAAANAFGRLKAHDRNGHFWRGRPGQWRLLLPTDIAQNAGAAHAPSFEELGYDLDPDAALTEEQARTNWDELRDAAPPDRPAVDERRIEVSAAAARQPARQLVDHLYRLTLRRTPDAAALERAEQGLRTGTLSPATLLHELVTSSEAVQVRLLDDAIAFAKWARGAGERPRALTAPAAGSERLIEIPWTLARYRGEARVLDVGSAFADPAYLAALPSLGAETLVTADLAQLSAPGIEAVVADARALPFPAEAFDFVLCISTLHCVGSDNRIYGLAAEDDPGGPLAALRELRRVLAPAGRLLLTVPCGEPQDLGWFVQDSRAGWERLFAAADFHPFEEEVYELTDSGWSPSPSFTEHGVRYAERGTGPSAVLCAELRPGRRLQAARRAVRHAGRRLHGKTTEDR